MHNPDTAASELPTTALLSSLGLAEPHDVTGIDTEQETACRPTSVQLLVAIIIYDHHQV
jgi:hypothetical protein